VLLYAGLVRFTSHPVGIFTVIQSSMASAACSGTVAMRDRTALPRFEHFQSPLHTLLTAVGTFAGGDGVSKNVHGVEHSYRGVFGNSVPFPGERLVNRLS
jgi:hypothetical protein